MRTDTIVLLPTHVRCIHCDNSIPLSQFQLSEGNVDCSSCGKESNMQDYGRFFGMIKDIRE